MAVAFSRDDPRVGSAAYQAQDAAYQAIDAVLGGAAAVRAVGQRHLPKYRAETEEEYRRRLMSAPWRPVFEDALRGIASKPFSHEVRLDGSPPASIKTFSEDVDTLGNNLHVFARAAFWRGVAFGLHGILVDGPDQNPARSREEERQLGIRPNWLHVPAQAIRALQTDVVGGRTVVTHVRIAETKVVPDGKFGEKTVEQVRILERGRWELWQEND